MARIQLLAWLIPCTVALVLASSVAVDASKPRQRVSLPLSHTNARSANSKRSITSLRPRAPSGLRKRQSSSSVPLTDEGFDDAYYVSVDIGTPRKLDLVQILS